MNCCNNNWSSNILYTKTFLTGSSLQRPPNLIFYQLAYFNSIAIIAACNYVAGVFTAIRAHIFVKTII